MRVLLFVTKIAILVAALVAATLAGSADSRSLSSAGSIALSGGGISVRSTSGQLTRLTTDFRDQLPVWSRDGKRIAFLRRGLKVDRCALFVMNADGGDVHEVGNVETDCSRVSWGPRDRKIAFGGVRAQGSMGLWVVNANGSGLRRLRAGRGATEGVHPAWSPNGRWIVFGWTGRSPHPWGLLAAVRPDGSGYRVLVKPRAGHDDEITFPAWSRDGKRLAYVRVDHRLGSAGRMLEVANSLGRHRRVLAHLPYNPTNQGAPSWSPNGRSLVYWQICGQSGCVATIPARGGKPHVLLQGDYLQPYWGPAGT